MIGDREGVTWAMQGYERYGKIPSYCLRYEGSDMTG